MSIEEPNTGRLQRSDVCSRPKNVIISDNELLPNDNDVNVGPDLDNGDAGLSMAGLSNELILGATSRIGGLKGSVSQILKRINSILDMGGSNEVRDLLSLQNAYNCALTKCVGSINEFCKVLGENSPRALEYVTQLREIQRVHGETRERINQFVIESVEAVSAARSTRYGASCYPQSSKTKSGTSKASKSGTRLKGQSAVKLKELQLQRIKRDNELREKTAQLQSQRDTLQAEYELEEAKLWADEDQGSVCLPELEGSAMTAKDRVEHFLNGVGESDLPKACVLEKESSGGGSRVELSHKDPQRKVLRAEAPELKRADHGQHIMQAKSFGDTNEVGTGIQSHVLCGSTSTIDKPNAFYDSNGSAKVLPPSVGVESDESNRLTTDSIARLLVRCRESPVIKEEDRFDGDPASYQRFILQFRDTVLNHYGNSDPAHALVQLAATTRGQAKRIVEACQVDDSPARALKQALEDLQEAFGAPQLQVDAKLKAIRDGPVIKPTADGLQDLYVDLLSCRNLLTTAKVEEELDAPATTEGIFYRLPKELQRRFVRFAVDKGFQIKRIPFNEVLRFVKCCRDEANSNFGRLLETFGRESKTGRERDSRRFGMKSGRVSAVHVGKVDQREREKEKQQVSQQSAEFCCPVCDSRERHGLWKCRKFLSMLTEERCSVVKGLKRCYCCLGVGHFSKDCHGKYRCRECDGLHHTLLHLTSTDTKVGPRVTVAAKSSAAYESSNSGSIAKEACRPRTRLKVLPVVVRNAKTGDVREVLAFLDGGADCHLVSKQLFDELGLEGRTIRSEIGLADGSSSAEDTHLTEIWVRGFNQVESYKLTSVIVKEKLADVGSSAPTPADIDRNPHLAGVEIPFIAKEKIDLIIGLSARILHEIHEKREAGADQLCAGKCLLGWFLYGNDNTVADTAGNQRQRVCFVSSSGPLTDNHVAFVKEKPKMQKETPKQWDLCLACLGSGSCHNCEGTGDRRCRPDPDVCAASVNDDRARMILEKTCTFKDGHYQIGLLWASDNPKLPDNYAMAKTRLESLGKRLRANPEVKAKYKAKIQDMLDEGHAVEVPNPSLDAVPGRTFYIPHHNVSSSKFRIVMDCAAKCQGVSLNSVLLQGPDNFNSLLGVLFRFRFYPVAIVADIRSMFFQVKCKPEDRSALRFLFWENGDPDQEVKVYQSTVHCFGLTCSPCVASYALARTADDNQSDFSETAIFNVKTNFYVDDWLTSVKNVSGAVSLIKEVDQLLTKGGFRLMKFASNELSVLEGIDSDRWAPSFGDIVFQGYDVPEQKSLGVIWSPKEDQLRVKVVEGNYAWTRRGFLSYESRFFDPLGVIDPFKLPAKLILRDLAMQGYDWDDQNLPPEIKHRWQTWVKNLNCLNKVALPRCHSGLLNAKFVELHCYSDASKIGYGIVYYLRVFTGNEYELSFALGKAKVLPAICTTTPRAELHAALELVDFSRTVVREHKLDFRQIVFWTDSQTVLGYVRNPNKRLPIFEANRVKKILEGSSADQWRWVPTNQNPADLFSRGASPSKPSIAEQWLRGPDYLLKDEEEWPAPSRDYHCFAATINLSPEEGGALANASTDDAQCVEYVSPVAYVTELLLPHYSTLNRLLKAVSWWRRFISLLRNRVNCKCGREEVPIYKGCISVAEYAQSLLIVIHLAQRQSFPGALEALESGDCHEIDAGKHGDMVKKILTPLRKYCPFVGEDSVMRIGGRLQKSSFSYDIKHPIVLPKRHHVTGLIIMDAHVQSGHFACNFVLNELLTKYHILGGKATVKFYLKGLCIECRNRNAQLSHQQTAPLPTGRVSVGSFPFEHCGVDYMCGLKVKQGRNELKRYACIFTCLCTRATVLEVVHDLTTESFLMAYRRFLAITGSVTKVLYSDNGSNFRGAAVELKRGIERMNRKRITGELALIGVEFRFNPPLASHQGGVFESIIRLVRKTMTALMDDRKLRTLSDEGLSTLLREVQMILNRRPLTRASSDPNDSKALCPQDILTGKVDNIHAPDTFAASDGLRASYRLSQAYTEDFWRRFMAEYVPTLNKREKWLAPQRNLQVGDLVMLHGEAGVRYKYAKAVVTNIYPDKFGCVRRVTVRAADGNHYDREVAKICLLEADGSPNFWGQK